MTCSVRYTYYARTKLKKRAKTKIPNQIVDIKRLYTNIPNEEGIQACYKALLQRDITDPSTPSSKGLKIPPGNGTQIEHICI